MTCKETDILNSCLFAPHLAQQTNIIVRSSVSNIIKLQLRQLTGGVSCSNTMVTFITLLEEHWTPYTDGAQLNTVWKY